MKNRKRTDRKILLLEYFTIVWNIIEGVVAITIGVLTSSVSLFAFGLESSVEVFSSMVAVWDMKGRGDVRNNISLKMISSALFAISIYIAFSAIKNIIDGHRPQTTVVSILVMTFVSLVMFSVGTMKKNLGKKIRNQVIVTESNFTLLDAMLSTSIILGLALNYFFGLWWIDSVLALVIASNAFREGLKGVLESLRGDYLNAEVNKGKY